MKVQTIISLVPRDTSAWVVIICDKYQNLMCQPLVKTNSGLSIQCNLNPDNLKYRPIKEVTCGYIEFY